MTPQEASREYIFWTEDAVKQGSGYGGQPFLNTIAHALRRPRWQPGSRLAATGRNASPWKLAYPSFSNTHLSPPYNVAAVFKDLPPLKMALDTWSATAVDGAPGCIGRPIFCFTKRRARLSFQFIFGHTDIAHRGRVDELAKMGFRLPQDAPAWSTDIAAPVRRPNVQDPAVL